MRRGCCAAARRDRGAAAVEFALVALPLFLILFGIIQYGFLFYEVQGAASAAKDGARAASLGIEDCGTWQDWTLARAEGNGVGATLSPTVGATFETRDNGDPTVTVTLSFAPRQIVPLVPVPDTVERTAQADVENFLVGGVADECLP